MTFTQLLRRATYTVNSTLSFFRKYAATNLDEFFAVASENFFERPHELNDNFPKLYEAFKKLYNQDLLTFSKPNPVSHESGIE